MIRFANLERLQDCLRGVPKVVDSQHRRSSSFPEDVLTWLKQAEADLESAHQPIVSEVAALRSRLLRTLHRSDIEVQSLGSSRKRREAIASSVLQEAQHLVGQALAPELERLREAEKIALRVASVARAKKVVDQAKQISPHSASLAFISSALRDDSDTAAAMVHLEGLLGIFDLLVVLDRAIPELA